MDASLDRTGAIGGGNPRWSSLFQINSCDPCGPNQVLLFFSDPASGPGWKSLFRLLLQRLKTSLTLIGIRRDSSASPQAGRESLRLDPFGIRTTTGLRTHSRRTTRRLRPSVSPVNNWCEFLDQILNIVNCQSGVLGCTPLTPCNHLKIRFAPHAARGP